MYRRLSSLRLTGTKSRWLFKSFLAQDLRRLDSLRYFTCSTNHLGELYPYACQNTLLIYCIQAVAY